MPGLGGQTVVGGKAFEKDWFFFPKWYIKNFHFLVYADSIWLCFYMSVSHACKVKYRSSHPIQIKFGSLMRLTIVYVCAKFHKNRFNSKKVMTDLIRVGGTSAGVAIMPGLGGQTVVGGPSVVSPKDCNSPNTVPVKIAGVIFCIVLMWFITHSAQI